METHTYSLDKIGDKINYKKLPLTQAAVAQLLFQTENKMDITFIIIQDLF